jgi:methyl-accepting chemotaxis protein
MVKLTIKSKIMLTLGGNALLFFVFAAIVFAEAYSAENRTIMTTAAIFGAAMPIVCIVLGLLLSKNISKPLKFFAECFAGIANSGNIFLDDYAYKQTKTLNGRGDDIGAISRSVGDLLAMFREKIRWLKAVKDGDLTASVANRSPQDTIGGAMGEMVGSLNKMLREIQSASVQMTDGSSKLDEGSKLLAEVSGEQASSIGRISETISDTNEHTMQNAEMAARAAELSKKIKALAEKSGEQMSEMTDAVNQIKDSGAEIGQVIKAIEEIAFQTNILAINAGVEAARAGQHGKGFAVVAQEVRMLAAKSQQAAKETENLITDSIGKSQLGSEIAKKTAASLREIVGGVAENVDLAEKIAVLSDKQARVIADVNAVIDEVNEGIKRSSYTASESAAESQRVSHQSEVLRMALERFKIA